MTYESDFYLYHLSLEQYASSNAKVNSISPMVTNKWFCCESEELLHHLQGDWQFASYDSGHKVGLADMQGLSVDTFVLPWGAGYTRRYLMGTAALYFAVDSMHLSKDRYDVFGNMWMGGSSGRVSISPMNSRGNGERKYQQVSEASTKVLNSSPSFLNPLRIAF